MIAWRIRLHLPYYVIGGGLLGAQLHICRTVTRRAERTVIPLVSRGDADPQIIQYLNRLSDYFFVAARYSTHILNREENTYKKAK